MKITFLLLGMVLFVVACQPLQTLQRANKQSILIQTPHVEGAYCVAVDNKGQKVALKDSPGVMIVATGHAPLTIKCKKNGYKSAIVMVDEVKDHLFRVDGTLVKPGINKESVTAAPRMLPGTIEESISFFLDPTAQITTKYPQQVAIWMEPRQWASDEARRAWSYDKYLYENATALHRQAEVDHDDDTFAQWEAEKEEFRLKKLEHKQAKKERWEDRKASVKAFFAPLNPLRSLKWLDDQRKALGFELEE